MGIANGRYRLIMSCPGCKDSPGIPFNDPIQGINYARQRLGELPIGSKAKLMSGSEIVWQQTNKS